MALCISWQLTQNLAQGSACKRLAEMGSSHPWHIPYVPSLTRISAASTSRSKLFSRLLRLRNSHSSWLCWLRSPESDGSSRRPTKAAAFSADIRRRRSLAFSRNARTLRSTPLLVPLLFICFIGTPLRRPTLHAIEVNIYDAGRPLEVSEKLQKIQ